MKLRSRGTALAAVTLAVVVCTLASERSFSIGAWASSESAIDPEVLDTFASCPRPRNESWWVGDRVVVAPNGLAFAYQCGNGNVFVWSAAKRADQGRIGLTTAAIKAGLIPDSVHCPQQGEDCSITDHTIDWTSYITWDTATFRLVTPNKPDRQIPGYVSAVLLPRSGPATEIIDGAGGFKTLELRSIERWSGRALVDVPRRNGMLQNNETQFQNVSWSNAYDLLLVTCNGAFIYFDGDVAYLRAYDRQGNERWSLRKSLTKPAKPEGLHEGFTATNMRLFVFAGGKFAAVSDLDEPVASFKVIDLENGRPIGMLTGRPLAAAADGTRVLRRVDDEHVQLVELRRVLKQ